jgi:hypothetical protein
MGETKGEGTAMGEGTTNEVQEDDGTNRRQGHSNGRGGNDEQGTTGETKGEGTATANEGQEDDG